MLIKGFSLHKNLSNETANFCEKMLRSDLDYQTYFYKKQNESEPKKKKSKRRLKSRRNKLTKQISESKVTPE